MAAKETTLNELGETLAYVVEHMATKDDLAGLRTGIEADIAGIRATMATKADLAALSEQVASIEGDLKTIRRDLSDLTDKVENIAGYRQEIDHALDRIAAIEHHVGIGRGAAA